MNRFITRQFVVVTVAEALGVLLAHFARMRHNIPPRFIVALGMAPFYFLIKQMEAAAPAWQKPADDGTYSIAGQGLEAINEANANRTDWGAVAFYSLYAVAVALTWVFCFRKHAV